MKAAVERSANATVLVDSTGKGEPIYEALHHADVWAQGYTFTARSKAALVDNLSLLLERRDIVLPRPELWPVGIAELEDFQYAVSDSGNVKTGAPGGSYDDCVMGMALAAWQVRHGNEGPLVYFG